MSRVKIVQYIYNRLNEGGGDFDYRALLDVVGGLDLADNADILADMLTTEPFLSHGNLADFIADKLIALNCSAVYDKLSERGASTEAVGRVLAHYRPQ
jgi:hypothetical protein